MLKYYLKYQTLKEKNLDFEYAINITLIPGMTMFVVAFLVFEVPYLREKRKRDKEAKEEALKAESALELQNEKERKSLVGGMGENGDMDDIG